MTTLRDLTRKYFPPKVPPPKPDLPRSPLTGVVDFKTY